MEKTNNQFWIGLILSSTTALFWGMIPIALKLSSGFADPVTLTWTRFTFAAVVVFLWQWQHHKLVEFTRLTRQDWIRLLVSGCFLIVNYTTFAWGLVYLPPEVAQLGMQISPLLMALGGALFFHERVFWQQWACFFALLAGLLIFFHPVLSGSYQGNMTTLLTGLVIIFVSTFSWSAYALTQKTLFTKLGSSNILLAIYVLALVVMLPFTHPHQLLVMKSADMGIMLFCCINTVVAYGAFTQAMRYWQTVQVSAVIAVVPVIVFILTSACVALHLWETMITNADVDALSILGMVVVVLSAISVQIASARLSRKKATMKKRAELSAV